MSLIQRLRKLHDDLSCERFTVREAARQAADKIEELQARIDELMLEYCPEEMTAEQLEEWAKHQVTDSMCPSCGRSWDEHEFTVPLACPIKEKK